MRKLLLIAGVAALAVPGFASAQPGCREQQHDNRVAGTVIGALGGALIGGAVAGHGSKGAGAVVGGVTGGVVGNVVGGASTNCANFPRGGYYDSTGVWHEADGYYDANGNWVDARPPAVDYSVAPHPEDYGADVAYTGSRGDLNARESWLEFAHPRRRTRAARSHMATPTTTCARWPAFATTRRPRPTSTTA